jgi:adenylylsulfate kinase-like enzyme
MIVNIIGQPGSGKTTLALELESFIESTRGVFGVEPIVIDGDEMRRVFRNQDYSEAGRRRNLTTAYDIARFLNSKGKLPILAMVSPFLDLREGLKAECDVLEVFLRTSETRGREGFFVKEYELPTSDFIEIDTGLPLKDCSSKLIDAVITRLTR